MNWVSGKVNVCTRPGWLVSSVPSSFTSTTCRRGWYLCKDCRTTICPAGREASAGRRVNAVRAETRGAGPGLQGPGSRRARADQPRPAGRRARRPPEPRPFSQSCLPARETKIFKMCGSRVFPAQINQVFLLGWAMNSDMGRGGGGRENNFIDDLI